MRPNSLWLLGIAVFGLLFTTQVYAQNGPAPVNRQGRTRSTDAKLLEQFDLDKNGWLNKEERVAARAFQAENQANRPRRRGGRGGGQAEPVVPGPRLKPADVSQYPGVDLYDPGTLRTLFLEFETDDWEAELEAFYHTDVELPATLDCDGKTYNNVGVQYRGNSSYFAVSKGRKKSMSITLDHVNAKQNIEGYRALTLLNVHADPTYLHSVLYLDMARGYMPAPRANYVRVVINGECWGIYVNQQRYNKDFLKEAFGTTKGIRIKSSNRSRGGGLSYLGENPDDYRQWYEIKSADKDESWKTLIDVCRILHETPPESLKSKLEPIFDIDGALRFLALDIVVMSGDGYWLHGSEINLYVDPSGVLHLLHHDANEAFSAQSNRGGRGERGPGEAKADLFVSMDDPNKALRQKLLVVPEFRTTYLKTVREIAMNSLDWENLGPKVQAIRTLIGPDVESETRKLYSTEQFNTATYGDGEDNPPVNTFKGFVQQRREFLLNHPAIKALDDGNERGEGG